MIKPPVMTTDITKYVRKSTCPAREITNFRIKFLVFSSGGLSYWDGVCDPFVVIVFYKVIA